MLHFTLIVRARDALALAADTDTSSPALERSKVSAKTLLRKLATDHNNPSTLIPPLLSVVDTASVYFIFSDSGVMFLTMCDTAASAGMAFAYLQEVAREFLQQYGAQVEAATRPYCFIKFDRYLQDIKRVFTASGSARSMSLVQNGRPAPAQRTIDEILRGQVAPAAAEAEMYGIQPTRKTIFLFGIAAVIFAAGCIVAFVLVL